MQDSCCDWVFLLRLAGSQTLWPSAWDDVEYSPVKKVDFGIMYLFANRKEDSGADDNLNRIQAMAKYSFWYINSGKGEELPLRSPQ